MSNKPQDKKARQRLRSQNFRKSMKTDGKEPVTVFLTSTTRAKLKSIASILKCPPQLPLILEEFVNVHLPTYLDALPAIEPEKSETAMDCEGAQPSKTEPPLRKSKKVKPASKVAMVSVEAFADLIERVRRLARACELETKRLRSQKVRAANSDVPPPYKVRRQRTDTTIYKDVLEEIELRSGKGESVEELEAKFKSKLEAYAALLETDLQNTQAELLAMGVKVKEISADWPPAPIPRPCGKVT